jgi:hypothetical protein
MRRILITAVAVASAAALASGLTITAAQASPSRAARTTAPRTTGPRATDAQTIRLISTTAGLKKVSTLATGHFTDGGYTVPGKLNPTTMVAISTMFFPDGSFKIYEHVTKQTLSVPTSRCLVTETIRGSYTLAKGTGVYAGISGSGGFITGINGVITESSGECGGAWVVFQEISTIKGTAQT